MATADSIGARGYVSDECFTYECDICKQDDIRKEAIIYCPECEEYLCSKCLEWHRKLKASKSHAVQHISEIKERTDQGNIKKITTLCSCNQRKSVSDYCADHRELLCSVCTTVMHKNCKKETIDDVSRDESVIPTFKKTADKINELVDKALKLKCDHSTREKNLVKMQETCKYEIREFKTLLHNWIDKLEENALADLQKRIETEKHILEGRDNSLDSALKLLIVDQKQIEKTEKTQDKCQMFITCTKIQKCLSDYEAVLKETERKVFISSIKFIRNSDLSNMMTDISCFGQINAQTVHSDTAVSADFLDIHSKGASTINIENDHDSNIPCISGMSFLMNNEFLIADYNNSRLTLLDTTLKIKESIKCSGRPWDIAVVDDKEVIVSLPDEIRLHYYTITPKLQAGRTVQLDVGQKCWGVAMTTDRIFVSCCPDILVLDRNGRVSCCSDILVLDRNGKVINRMNYLNLRRPFYITSRFNNLYVSDCDTNRLRCITHDGNSVFTYSDSDLKAPRKVLVDAEGNALLCGESSKNIHVVKSDGTKHRFLLTLADGLIKPLGMALSLSGEMLIVGGWNQSILNVYRFK